VADKTAPDGRAVVRVASVDKPGYLSDGDGFVVRVDAGNAMVTCTAARRGSRGDFTDDR
jgi:hypothetical protein